MTDNSWMAHAACLGMWSRDEDNDPFFPSERWPTKAATSKRICHTCPVKTECLQTAETQAEIHGTWGGETASARRLRTGIKPRPPRQHEPCGTPAAARRHYTNNQPLDQACRKASARATAERNANRKANG